MIHDSEDDSPNVALLKFIESNVEYLRNVGHGASIKDIVFSERFQALKVFPSKKIELRRT